MAGDRGASDPWEPGAQCPRRTDSFRLIDDRQYRSLVLLVDVPLELHRARNAGGSPDMGEVRVGSFYVQCFRGSDPGRGSGWAAANKLAMRRSTTRQARRTLHSFHPAREPATNQTK